MHDCPACRVPLHGYEDVCPSCGTKQVVRKGSNRFNSFKSEQPGINWWPIVLSIIACGIVVLCAVPNSWIGEIMKGPRPEDPMEKLSYLDARNIVEQGITKNLSAIGATGKFSWQNPADNSPIDKNLDQNVSLSIDTTLSSPDLRKGVIDPIKEYMAKAKIGSLTMNDSRSHATWTYNVSTPLSPAEE